MTFKFKIRCRLKRKKLDKHTTVHHRNFRRRISIKAGSIESAVASVRRLVESDLEYLAVERGGFSRTLFGTPRREAA